MSRTKGILTIGAGVVFGSVLVVMGWIEFRNSKKLAAEGKAVTAKVTGKDIQRGRRGRKSYYVEIQFKTEAGAAEAQSVKVGSSQYDAVKVGGNVPVHYLPSDPKVCQIGEKIKTRWSMMLWGLGAWAASAVVGFSKSDDDQAGEATPATSNLTAIDSSADDHRKAA